MTYYFNYREDGYLDVSLFDAIDEIRETYWVADEDGFPQIPEKLGILGKEGVSIIVASNGLHHLPECYVQVNGQDVSKFDYEKDGKIFGYTCDEFGNMFEEIEAEIPSEENELPF